MKTHSQISLVFLLLALFFSHPARAAYLKNVQVTVNQPDGSTLQLLATGDDYHNWLHDSNNYTIIQDPQSGYYVYATLVNGELAAGPHIVGQSDPQQLGLPSGLNITAATWLQKREAMENSTPKKPGAGGLGALFSETSGTLNNLVVFIRFSDQGEFPQAISYYDDMFNTATAGANSMYNYFKEVSYDNMYIPSTYYPLPAGTAILSYQDSHPRAYYMPYNAVTNPDGYQESERTSREHTLLKNAVEYIAGQVPPSLNIDFDNDNYADNVCFIIKGGTTAWSTLLWPHRWALYSQTVYINGKRVWDYNFQLEDFLPGSGVGVLSHEMMHTMGCPDLYHYSENGISPVGVWDLMASNTNPPQHIGAYQKLKYTGWIPSIPLITSTGTYTLNPLTSSTNNAYRLNTPNSATEFFVFEYRKAEGPFESSLPGSGLLIYRINTAAGDGNASGPPDEIYVYRPNGTPTANGNLNNAYFSFTAGRTTFNNTTNPYDFLSDGVTLGDINVQEIGTAGSTLTFSVFMGTVANFSANMTQTCTDQTILFIDQSTGGPTSWNWSFSPPAVTYVNGTSASSQNPQVQFTASGSFSVTLIINGPSGTDTLTRENYVHIQAPQGPPFTDNFESGSFLTQGWRISNPDEGISWDLYTGAGGNGSSTQCAYMNFNNYPDYPQVDALIMPPITFSGFGSAQLSFKVAYRQWSEDYHDSLIIKVSTNCGSTYSFTLYSKSGATLATGPAIEYPFVPSVAADWRTEIIDLSGFLGTTIIIKFIGVNGYGNNLYIDDINLTGSAPVLAAFTGNPTNPCNQGLVQFTNQSSGNPTSWFWNFGDGGTSSLQNPTHQYTSTGNFNVSLTVTKAGNTNTLTKVNYIQVQALNPVSASISQSPPGTLCQGYAANFEASVVNPGSNPTYQWKRNSANVGSNSPLYTVSNLSSGETISCVVTSNISCPSGNPAVSNNIQVSVQAPLTASVSISANPSVVICQGNEVIFTATPQNGGETPAYQWKVNGLAVGENQASFICNSLQHGDVVSCSMTSSHNCLVANPVVSNLLVMTVNPTVAASVGISASPAGPVCTGTNVVFSAVYQHQGQNPVFQWKVNNSNVGGNTPVFSSYQLNNGDQVQCVMSSSLACVTNNPAISNQIQMTVGDPMPVSLSIGVNPSTSICQGQTVVFTAQPVNGGSSPGYVWRKNGSLAGYNPTYTTSALNNGDVVTCQLTSSLICPVGSPFTSGVTMSVSPYQNLQAVISADPGTSVCEGSQVVFSAAVTNGGNDPSYQWKKNGQAVGNAPQYSSSSLQSGDQVQCTVTSSASCIITNPMNSNTLQMNILPLPQPVLGNDTTIIYGNELLLDAGSGYASYLWSTGQSTQSILVDTCGTYSVSVTDQLGCQGSDAIEVSLGSSQLFGMVTYLNANGTPMNNTEVVLKQGSTVITQTTSDAQGYYSFAGLEAGSYKIVPASQKPWGGANSTDALLIMKHFVNISPLTGLKVKAANVDNSPFVNSLDALMVQKRAIGTLGAFPAGNWVFDNPTVMVPGDMPVEQHLNALTTGDVNGSFQPAAFSPPSLSLIAVPELVTTQHQEVLLPLFSDLPLQLGAITLFLEFAPEACSISEVVAGKNRQEDLLYAIHGNILAVSWANPEPMVLEAGEALLWLRLKLVDGSREIPAITVLPTSELADEEAVVYTDVKLFYPGQLAGQSQAGNSWQVYPNPANHFLTIHFSLAKAGQLSFSICSPEGKTLETIAQGYFGEGPCQLQVDLTRRGAYGLSPGVYILRMQHSEGIHTKRLLILR